MATLYLTEQHSLVRREAEYLVVQVPEDREHGVAKRRIEVPLIKVDEVVVMGDVTITTAALHSLLDSNVTVSYLSWNGSFKGRLSPRMSKNSLVRLEQHRAHDDSKRTLSLAKAFVRGKLVNMRTVLMRYNRKLGSHDVGEGIDRLKRAADRVGEAESIDTLLGLEGAGSAVYFGLLPRLLKQELGFRRRSRRPPTDPVNSALSFGYALLANAVSAAVQSAGLDPYIGYLHSSQYGKPALVLDIMEEFRPVIVDSVVITAVNNRALGPRDFVEEMGAYRLTDTARKDFLHRFEDRLSTAIIHPVFGYQTIYRRCLDLQARLLAKAVTGDVPEYVPFLVR